METQGQHHDRGDKPEPPNDEKDRVRLHRCTTQLAAVRPSSKLRPAWLKHLEIKRRSTNAGESRLDEFVDRCDRSVTPNCAAQHAGLFSRRQAGVLQPRSVRSASEALPFALHNRGKTACSEFAYGCSAVRRTASPRKSHGSCSLAANARAARVLTRCKRGGRILAWMERRAGANK